MQARFLRERKKISFPQSLSEKYFSRLSLSYTDTIQADIRQLSFNTPSFSEIEKSQTTGMWNLWQPVTYVYRYTRKGRVAKKKRRKKEKEEEEGGGRPCCKFSFVLRHKISLPRVCSSIPVWNRLIMFPPVIESLWTEPLTMKSPRSRIFLHFFLLLLPVRRSRAKWGLGGNSAGFMQTRPFK